MCRCVGWAGCSPWHSCAALADAPALQVSDIKRANALLSDTGMYAKDTLLIPKQAMAVGCVVDVLPLSTTLWRLPALTG